MTFNPIFEKFDNCQTRVQTMSRPTLDVSQVISNSISISDTGGLDLSRHYNCFIPPTTTRKLFGVFQNILEYSTTYQNILDRKYETIPYPPPPNPYQTKPYQITNYQLQIATYKLPLTNCQLQIANYKLPITNCKLQIANYKQPITNCQLPVTNYKLPIANY